MVVKKKLSGSESRKLKDRKIFEQNAKNNKKLTNYFAPSTVKNEVREIEVTSSSSESMDIQPSSSQPVCESNIQAENINPQDWYKEHKIDKVEVQK